MSDTANPNLIPFRPGPDHRRGTAGRPHPLNDPEFAKLVAQAFVDGNNRRVIADMFGVKDLDTITKWRRDPRVKVYANKLMEDRVLEVTRKVDAKIANILANQDLSVKDLLAIRKEFLGGALRMQTESADDLTIGEGQEWLENAPNAVEKLEALFAQNDPK
jgi:hypothetical protein